MLQRGGSEVGENPETEHGAGNVAGRVRNKLREALADDVERRYTMLSLNK